MLFSDISARVAEIIQDASLTGDANMKFHFDRCLADLVERLNFSALVVTDTFTVSADASTGALPDDYLRNIIYAYNADTDTEIQVVSPADMWDLYPRMDGVGESVEYIAVHNGAILAQPAPEEDVEITIRYFSKHETVDDLSDTVPSYIPAAERYNIFAYYVLAQLYDILEDGIDGSKINTLNYRAKYRRAFHNIDWLNKLDGSEIAPGDIKA